MGQLSRDRDGFQRSFLPADSFEDLVASLNHKNGQWVEATRGISPRLLIDLLALTGEQAHQHFSSLDPFSTGPEVSWVAAGPAPMWLHVAREYTERWHHQQQIREATGKSLLTTPKMFAPVLATFVHGVPRAYRGVRARDGSAVKLSLLGDSGGVWFVVRVGNGWKLYADAGDATPDGEITISQEDAWRLFTKSVSKEAVLPGVRMSGDVELASRALDTVSVIA